MINEKKEYEECQSFQECVDELVRRTVVRIKEEMPDKGSFSDIFELFCNPDDGTSDVVGKYGLHVFKMQSDIVPVGSGTKAEILELMKEPSFAEKLNCTFGELLDMLQDF